jgi:hypothetical protein
MSRRGAGISERMKTKESPAALRLAIVALGFGVIQSRRHRGEPG